MENKGCLGCGGEHERVELWACVRKYIWGIEGEVLGVRDDKIRVRKEQNLCFWGRDRERDGEKERYKEKFKQNIERGR